MTVMRSMLLIVLVFSVIGCSKDKETEKDLKDLIPETGGNYKGTFQRQTATGGQVVSVAMDLGDSSFTGLSPSALLRYPVIGRGTFTISGDIISFKDTCVYTTDFDGTLILSRQYKLSKNGDSLIISRDYNNQTRDIYKLKKQP